MGMSKGQTLPEQKQRRLFAAVPGRAMLILPLLSIATGAAFLLGIGIGGVAIEPLQIITILLKPLGIELDVAYTTQQEAVLWAIRLPRVVLALLVGSALAVAGTVLQGIFRNPLADPSLIGVSSGAAVGAVGSIILRITFLGTASLPVAAFSGGLLATLIVYLFARHNGRTEVVTLILTGIALNAIAGAVIGLLTFLATDEQLRDIVFWSMGSLGGATWEPVIAVTPFILLGLVLIPLWGRTLNLLVLGEREARHLGVATERVRLILIVLAALITSASVAVCGSVGFVGLVVPHLIRLAIGPDHRLLIVASALTGASLLLLADLGARTLVLPSELPLGAVTALVGGPFFLWLLYRTRKEHGGWN